jgi:hypothetical protein
MLAYEVRPEKKVFSFRRAVILFFIVRALLITIVIVAISLGLRH